jgi:AAA15 family ATPase/GTPase
MSGNIRFTIKNYRCFLDSDPLIFNFGSDSTALVGPNNSGKSSFLKFFYEFRQIWSQFSPPSGDFIEKIRGVRSSINPAGVDDPTEIYSNQNDRDLSIEIEFNSTIRDPNMFPIKKCFFQFSHAHTADLKMTIIDTRGNQSPFTNPRYNNQNLAASGFSGEIDLNDIRALFQDLQKIFYIGPYRNAISEAETSYYDLAIGTAFIREWDEWKNGNIKARTQRILNVTEDIKGIFGFKSLEINATPDKKALQLNINGKPYRLRELGGGLAQFIVVLANAAIRKPTYILIDEPELNLHSTLQIDFLSTLASYSTKGILFATHSIGLARSHASQIYSFQLTDDGKSLVRPFEQIPNYAEFLGEMGFANYRELGFEKILLIEGPSDLKTVQQFLRKHKIDHKIVLLPLGGSSMINERVEEQLSELKRLTSDKIYVLIDSEKKLEAEEISADRKGFVSICHRLGFDVHVTKRRAIENYLVDNAIKQVMGEKYKSLAHYEKLEETTLAWSKDQNWRIAQAMDLSDIKGTDVGDFFQKIATEVNNSTGVDESQF